MRVVDIVEAALAKHVRDTHSDEDILPGLSPCLVRAALLDVLENDNLAADDVTRAVIGRALSNEFPIPQHLLLSVPKSVAWLCTRYAELPECQNSPWGELDLIRKLALLRGGVRGTSEVGFRRFGR